MRSKHKKKGKKSSPRSDRNRKGSTCELCAHEDDTPCGASCVKGLENPLVMNTVCFQRRSPLITLFYCQCAQLYAEIHRMMQLPVSDNFQEAIVSEMGDKVLVKLKQVLEDSTSDDETPPMCPLVMLLSILLPSLRKHLEWVLRTRPAWAATGDGDGSGGSPSTQSTSGLLSMIALHNALMKITLEYDKISCLIELNESTEEEQVYARPKPTGTSSSSVQSLFAKAPPPTFQPHRIPQIKKISLEFEEVFAEYKCELAGVTESILETTEANASRLCRPLMTKDASKSRGSVTEFMELLVLQVLDPIGKRVIAAPSPSWPYLCPRILERCISVAMDEFVFDNVKMNEILAAQFEKGVSYLRSWSLKLEMDYNSALRRANRQSPTLTPRSSESQLAALAAKRDAAASGSQSSSRNTKSLIHQQSDAIATQKLQLVTHDGFKRLDHVLNSWLRGAGKEEEVLSARTRMKANLGGLRTTIARSISTKSRKEY